MGIVSQERFTQLMAAAPLQAPGVAPAHNSIRVQICTALGIAADAGRPWQIRNDEASAIECYNQIKQYIQQNGYIRHKVLRPWEIDDQLYAGLDRAEPWWGFEFETGYTSQQSRATAVGYVWDNFHGVCFDSEGEGNAAVEITFGPQEVSKFEDGTAQAFRFMTYLDENPGLVYNGGANNIGTHINMSHPLMTTANQQQVLFGMNRSVAAIPREKAGVGNVRQLMFGRAQLYGGFFAQVAGTSCWLEGKLFRTTYTRNVFDRYIKVCKAMTTAMGAIAEAANTEDGRWQAELGAKPYVNNLYEMAFDGADPEIRWSKQDAGSRGAIQGEYGNDHYKDPCPQSRAEVEAELTRVREAKRIAAEIKARQKELDVQYERERQLRWANPPADLPAGYIRCEDCEDYHDDDGMSIYFINDADRLIKAA